ncbi:PA0069 family radical SAM protein [Chitinimonas sp. BJYL2]|uniref:PA0069 family radical SAM protein n=1 Tax=Chitinimonas sp. BJYL2 TaxID=2976696 RepID=UPI0022B5BF9F|nr:PA0069 family radical SAM protein [Chitinimonas sp. BJYL2]
MSAPVHGRGTGALPDNRFAQHQREAVDDGWTTFGQEDDKPRTVIQLHPAKSIISHNQSPDVPFSQSINPYQGCEHGCIYCYARPSHAYWGYSPGLDFETQIIAKPNAAALLRTELAKPTYRPSPICIGSNTDCYQPAERGLALTRRLLEVMVETRHPVQLLTKNALIERDIDLLADLARDGLVHVMVSVTTLDRDLARRLEPRASQPLRRLDSISALARAGIPVGVLVAPIIPALNDHELERILQHSRDAGACSAGYVLLRLPRELADLFDDWLQQHYPDRRQHVLSLLRQSREGALNDPAFGGRMRGSGLFAELLRQRFRLATQRLGLAKRSRPPSSQHFRPPRSDGQLGLFD